MPDRARLQTLADLAHRLIHELHARAPDDPTFTQLGLLDGRELVHEYLGVGETGCDIHHLLYMVHEANIPFPPHAVRELHRLAQASGETNYYCEAALRERTAEQRAHVHNRLRDT